ncbi:MAG: hypothetical protein IPO27_03915 [Bacteroidetes bacterium]|nr:hypothetical protein [Bacteroidota bacterium]
MNQRIYTSNSPAHARWTSTFVLTCLLLVSGLFNNTANAQCIQGSAFGTATLSATVSGSATIGCNFGGEYGTWNSAVTGNTYNFTSTIGTDYLTISAAPGGPAIAFGTQPLSWVSTVTGTIYVHVSTNPSCGTANSCRDITGTTTAIFVAGCTNGSAFGTATLSGALNGAATIGCNFAGEYGTWNGAVTGTTYNFTSTIGTDYLTIHTGSPAGPIVASGTQPLSWVSTVTGTIYVHVNTNSACGTANSCRDITGTTTALPVITLLTPFTGSNSIACGTNTTLCTHAGCGVTYSNSVDGHTIINAANSAVININGTYSTESSFDFITIYAGSGTGGAILFGPVSGSGTINYTGLPGQTLTVRFTSDGSVTSTGYNLAVTYTGSCLPPNLLVPFTGSNTNPCGTNVTLCSHAGCGVAYNSNANGSTTLLSGGTAAININGTYSTEASFDFITIYNGVGTGGTILFGPVSGSGTINYTGLPGQILTVGFTSDGSVTSTGFSLAVTYTGLCAPPCLITASAAASPTSVCPGGVSTLTATAASNNGAVSYLWSTSETTQSISAGPGTYTVTVTDLIPANCSASATVVVGVNSTAITTAATATTICNGASSTLSATQGTSNTLSWVETLVGGVTTPAQCATWDAFRASLVPAPYTSCAMSGTFDPIGRTATTPATVQAIANALKNATTFSALDGANTWVVGLACGSGCGGGAVELSADGTSCSCTSPGYNVRPNLVGSNSGGVNTATCGGPTQTITVSFSSNSVGPLNTYSWAPAAGLSCTTCATPVASPSVTTTYTVTGTLSNGCTGTATITINVTTVNAVCNGTNVSCNGGSNGTASVSASAGTPGYSYLWSNSGTDASQTGLVAGTYTVTVTDANGCTGTCSYTVTEPALLVGNCSGTNVSCNGGSNGTAMSAPSGGTSPYTYVWSNSGTDASQTGLVAGTYTVTVTDANGCTATCSYTVTEPALLVGNCSGTNVSCSGGSDGSAISAPTGGTSPYTYVWSNTGSNASITGLMAGTYTVTVTDANGCTATCEYSVTQPAAIVAGCSGTNNVCFGGAIGTASVSASGGTNTFTYLWSNGGTDASQTALIAGTYTVTVTDANGCIATCSYTVTEPTALTLSTSHQDVNCFGDSNGSVTATAGGGTPVYSYLWNTGAATSTVTGLAVGTYTVTVTDANGCTITGTAQVGSPAQLIGTITGTINVTCNGASTGSATLTASGGHLPYNTYMWSNGQTTATATGLAAGTYTATVTDHNGCTASASVTITQPASLAATCSGTNVTCNGFSDGSASVVAAGGTSPYTYAWSNGSTNVKHNRISCRYVYCCSK